MTDDENLAAPAGWCVPSEVLYDADYTVDTGPDWNEIYTFPKIQVARGGIKFEPPTGAERAASEALQSLIARRVGNIREAQDTAIDNACIIALSHRWDIHLQRSWNSRFVGIMFVPGEYRLPVIYEHRDDWGYDWEDD